MASFIAKAFGIGTKALLGSDTPKASRSGANSVQQAARKAKKSRTALFETEGGVSGQELQPDQVTQRNTLLGN